MINFEEELKNFKPSLEVEDAEQAIYNHELVDMTDMMQEMLQELKQGVQVRGVKDCSKHKAAIGDLQRFGMRGKDDML